MKKAESMLIERHKRGDPLVVDFKEENFSQLIERLRERFSQVAAALNLSPESLKVLEEQFTAYRQQTVDKLSEEELLQLIREVSAYLAQVMLLHLKGAYWDSRHGLWRGMVVVPDPRRLFGHPKQFPLAYTIGEAAAFAWDEGADLVWQFEHARKRMR